GRSMRARTAGLWLIVGMAGAAAVQAADPGRSHRGVADPAAAERGRVALTLTGFLKPEWSEAAYRRAGRLWDEPAPDPDRDPAGYAAAFRDHYGLHPAPYPNNGLPMGPRGRPGAR